MGARPYWYFVPYQADAGEALSELQTRELNAGRYNPVTPFPGFPVDADRPPIVTAGHATIEEALRDAGEDGTRSILDIFRGLADAPGFCQAAPYSSEQLTAYFGTPRPTRTTVETNLRALSFLERGHCMYVVVYEDDEPRELLFIGYSFD